jgi:hypothetical protein
MEKAISTDIVVPPDAQTHIFPTSVRMQYEMQQIIRVSKFCLCLQMRRISLNIFDHTTPLVFY